MTVILVCDGASCQSVIEPKDTAGSVWRMRSKPEGNGEVWHFCSDRCEGTFLLAKENERDNVE